MLFEKHSFYDAIWKGVDPENIYLSSLLSEYFLRLWVLLLSGPVMVPPMKKG